MATLILYTRVYVASITPGIVIHGHDYNARNPDHIVTLHSVTHNGYPPYINTTTPRKSPQPTVSNMTRQYTPHAPTNTLSSTTGITNSPKAPKSSTMIALQG